MLRKQNFGKIMNNLKDNQVSRVLLDLNSLLVVDFKFIMEYKQGFLKRALHSMQSREYNSSWHLLDLSAATTQSKLIKRIHYYSDTYERRCGGHDYNRW